MNRIIIKNPKRKKLRNGNPRNQVMKLKPMMTKPEGVEQEAVVNIQKNTTEKLTR